MSRIKHNAAIKYSDSGVPLDVVGGGNVPMNVVTSKTDPLTGGVTNYVVGGKIAPVAKLPFSRRNTVVHDAPPTITYSASQPAAGRHALPWKDVATPVGCAAQYNQTFGRLDYGVGGGMTGIDTIHTGDTLTFGWRCETSTKERVVVYVDGRPCMSSPATPSVTTAGGNSYYMTIAFASVATRRVEILVSHANALLMVSAGLNGGMKAAPQKTKLLIIGDSINGGSAMVANNTEIPCSKIAMAYDVNVASASFGGTGYVNSGAFGVFGSASRIASAVSFSPDIIVFMGSVNDDGAAGIQAAATKAYADYKSAIPSARIIVFGPQPTNANDTLHVNRKSNNQQIRAAAIASQSVDAFYDMIGNADPATEPTRAFSAFTYFNPQERVTSLGSVWTMDSSVATQFPGGGAPGAGTYPQWKLETADYFGTGQVGGAASNGSRDVMLGADGIHPTAVACSAFAERMAAAVMAM